MSTKKEKPIISFTQTHILYATPEKVFEALSNPEIIADWSGDEAILEPVPGGKFGMFGNWVKGEVLIYEPGKKLSYSWKPNTWKKNDSASIVIYTFRNHEAGTEVFLEHSDFPNQEEADSHFDGWVNHVFDPLNEFFTI